MNPLKSLASDTASFREISDRVDETLRLIAQMPVPDGLEGRIQAAVEAAPRESRVLSWPVESKGKGRWVSSTGFRAAAAAAIVCVVLGGGWGILMHIQVAQPPTATVQPQPLQPAGNGGFSSAGAIRTPQTLNGPVVTPAAPAKNSGKADSATIQKPVVRTGTSRADKNAAGPVAAPIK
jgi:hypothetical protein